MNAGQLFAGMAMPSATNAVVENAGIGLLTQSPGGSETLFSGVLKSIEQGAVAAVSQPVTGGVVQSGVSVNPETLSQAVNTALMLEASPQVVVPQDNKRESIGLNAVESYKSNTVVPVIEDAPQNVKQAFADVPLQEGSARSSDNTPVVNQANTTVRAAAVVLNMVTNNGSAVAEQVVTTATPMVVSTSNSTSNTAGSSVQLSEKEPSSSSDVSDEEPKKLDAPVMPVIFSTPMVQPAIVANVVNLPETQAIVSLSGNEGESKAMSVTQVLSSEQPVHPEGVSDNSNDKPQLVTLPETQTIAVFAGGENESTTIPVMPLVTSSQQLGYPDGVIGNSNDKPQLQASHVDAGEKPADVTGGQNPDAGNALSLPVGSDLPRMSISMNANVTDDLQAKELDMPALPGRTPVKVAVDGNSVGYSVERDASIGTVTNPGLVFGQQDQEKVMAMTAPSPSMVIAAQPVTDKKLSPVVQNSEALPETVKAIPVVETVIAGLPLTQSYPVHAVSPAVVSDVVPNQVDARVESVDAAGYEAKTDMLHVDVSIAGEGQQQAHTVPPVSLQPQTMLVTSDTVVVKKTVVQEPEAVSDVKSAVETHDNSSLIVVQDRTSVTIAPSQGVTTRDILAAYAPEKLTGNAVTTVLQQNAEESEGESGRSTTMNTDAHSIPDLQVLQVISPEAAGRDTLGAADLSDGNPKVGNVEMGTGRADRNDTITRQTPIAVPTVITPVVMAETMGLTSESKTLLALETPAGAEISSPARNTVASIIRTDEPVVAGSIVRTGTDEPVSQKTMGANQIMSPVSEKSTEANQNGAQQEDGAESRQSRQPAAAHTMQSSGKVVNPRAASIATSVENQAAAGSADEKALPEIRKGGETNPLRIAGNGNETGDRRQSEEIKTDVRGEQAIKSDFNTTAATAEKNRALAPPEITRPEEHNLVQQVKTHLTERPITPGADQITLKLTPDNMGEVKVNLNLQGNKLSVEIVTDNATARDAILKNSDTLKESLARQNITVGSFDVSTNSQGNSSSQQGQNSDWRQLVRERNQSAWLSGNNPAATSGREANILHAYQRKPDYAMVDIHY